MSHGHLCLYPLLLLLRDIALSIIYVQCAMPLFSVDQFSVSTLSKDNFILHSFI